jgi:processive 1,2-diacylglycerol beta-glucosyltransferase
MIALRDKETGAEIGRITDEQLKILIDRLEEESEDDADYYINRDTLMTFAEEGVDGQLLQLLDKALGDRDEMEIRWERR